MDPYVVTFHLGLGIGVIGPDLLFTYLFYRYLGTILTRLNREIGLIVYLFDIYIKYPPDNSNRSNLLSDRAYIYGTADR